MSAWSEAGERTDVRPAMTKTEVRAWLKRTREGLAWAEQALRDGSLADLGEALVEITGSASQVQSAVLGEGDHVGVRGLA